MNYRETRLKDETGFLWAGIKCDEFLKNSAAIFCKKISSEKEEKNVKKVSDFSLVFSVRNFVREADGRNWQNNSELILKPSAISGQKFKESLK